MSLAHRLFQHLLAAAPPALGLTALGCGLAIAALDRGEAALQVGPGEMIRYLPESRMQPAPGVATAVEAMRLAGQGLQARAEGEACRFDAAAMRQAPGSLLVVAVEPGGAMLHLRWAGGPTDAAADCGTEAEIRLSREGFVRLRNLAAFGLPALPPANF
ncbi:hypothetical protein [Paracraurococcus lichenis]|uniref:Uncharacterized protein n=1 Tax=Paracraurococcus lichenis TaxID=3064888 RepID=A0ABT9E1D1_9PROT|nr:hypothetical protein [Paracraurococcus sp. LOR1-02]MDO9709953.1 hypothetical protein [Paracraurococcus sp. LOR1-02]